MFFYTFSNQAYLIWALRSDDFICKFKQNIIGVIEIEFKYLIFNII